MPRRLLTPAAQFEQAASALQEAENLHEAKYWAACVSNAYQVALRSGAGLLYARHARPATEREVRIGFAAAFVSPGFSDPRFDQGFRRLEALRHLADYDVDHTTTREEATEALDLARAFWAEANRLRSETGTDSSA